MQYFSTNHNAPAAGFREATIRGLAPDKGLYFPEQIPVLPRSFFESLSSFSKEEIALKVIQPYVGDSIPETDLQHIIAETINFDFPLTKLDEDIYSLELYHGPTLAFKDVGARFMSRCLGHFVKGQDRGVTVLVATSGDTGGAVANGFYEVDGVNVVILYPSGKVSSIQELQLTTLGKNITALEVHGNFDDCQSLVKQAFADRELNSRLFLTSANSINVARWLPQQFYYFFALKGWQDMSHPPVFCVPSGNFGNICAGLLAARSGLPVKHFVAACNANDVIPDYLQTGNYLPKKAVATLSNAMDVGNPSNFERILQLFHRELAPLQNCMSSYSISDEETRRILREVYNGKGYLLDPHGAVGYAALQQYLEAHPGDEGILLETAHPVKFYDVVEPVIGDKVPVPELLRGMLTKEKKRLRIDVDYDALKGCLLDSAY